MTITEREVQAVARLARLSLSSEEAEALSSELDAILGYVKKLDELDTSAVAPTLQVSASRAPFRQDAVAPGLPKAEILSQAPRADEIGFLVPAFVDES